MNDLFYIQWHITNSCNLRCKHCYQDDFSGSRDLEWTELQKVSGNVVSTLRRWGRSACIHLTGGEPLLKPELFPLMAALDQDPMIGELGIITNGVLFDREITSRLADVSKLRKIKVSLDGATPEVNDAIRPRGTYDRVIECIRRLEEGNRFEITVMFTVMKSNFRDLAALIRLCQDLKVQGLILERFIPWGRGREIRGEVLGKEEWNELLETLADLLGVGPEEGLLTGYQAFQITFRDGEMELLGAPCVVGQDGLCLMPDGTVFPCRRFPVSLGNLLREPLHRIWEESELLGTLRLKENLKGKCHLCDRKDCRGCRSLALSLTGDAFSEDPHCTYPGS